MFNDLDRETVFDIHGNPYLLTRMIGFGGQGSVYEEESGVFVVKIANIRNAAHKAVLERRYNWLLQKDFDNLTKVVVPETLLAPPYLGYVMKRVKGHHPLSSLLKPSTDIDFGAWYNKQIGGLKRRLLIGAMIARAFHAIHISGLAYCDLSDTNILIAKDPKILSICLIDPDNLSISGKAESLVLGTPRYMAPEIVRGTHQPDSLTDSFSLAVMLFQLLRMTHPFIGDLVYDAPPEEEEKAFRGELPYIDHPEDESNRCSYGLPEEYVCTTALSELFRRAFIEGVNTRTKRPTPSEFEQACYFASYKTTKCDNCLATFFPKALAKQVSRCMCPWCETIKRIPPYLLFYDEVVISSENKLRGENKLSSAIVLRPGETPITSKFLSRVDDMQANIPISKVYWDEDTGTVLIENIVEQPLYLKSKITKRFRKLKSGESQLIEPEQIIYFENPESHFSAQEKSSQTVRCAKLVFKKE